MKNRGWIAFLSFVIAYVASHIIFAAAGFTYNIFSDPFNLGKLVIDFGVWGVLYALSYFVLARVLGPRTG
jgi:hypothetical protein